MAKKESEVALQVMFFSKNKKQSEQVHNFIKEYKGQLMISVPVRVK